MKRLRVPLSYPAPDDFDGVSQTACRGGSFAVESVAAFAWNGWQASSGISGNLGLEYAADGDKHEALPVMMVYPHLNTKRIWRRTTGQKRKNEMVHALEFHWLAFEGHHHRGFDDARNMVRLLPFMDLTLEEELLTPPKIAHSEGRVTSNRVVSIEEMDLAIREEAEGNFTISSN